jgi:hypothetical protein
VEEVVSGVAGGAREVVASGPDLDACVTGAPLGEPIPDALGAAAPAVVVGGEDQVPALVSKDDSVLDVMLGGEARDDELGLETDVACW